MMEQTSSNTSDHLSRVRIPGHLQSQFGEIFAAIERRVLQQAAQIALARENDNEVIRISQADVLEAAKVVFPTAAADVERILGVDQNSYVRRAS